MSDDAEERAHGRVGNVLDDKWTLEKLVGIGGMAAVYAGVHRNGARAAVKVLHPALARRSELRERFLREGYAANRVNHSGVVKVLDDDVIESGPDEGGAFLVMELLHGESVEDRIERGPPIHEKELLAIAAAVLDVLAAAHKAGVVHRDLKPENLFLARDPEKKDSPPKIKILDFGLARVAEAGNKTMAGIAIGTPSYMPPEQAAGRVFEIDARSDLFALGATCFRILAGRTVHPAESALAICALMAKDPAPKLRTVAPNVSPKTAAAIDRALEFKRDDRFPDATSMRKAIDEAIADLGGDTIEIDSGMIEVEPPPPAEAPAKEPSEHEPAKIEREEREPEEEEREEKKSGSSLGWLFALIVLIGLGVGGKLAYDRFGAGAAPSASASAIATAPSATMSATVTAPSATTTAVVAPEFDANEGVGEASVNEDEGVDAAADGSVDASSDAEITDAHAGSALQDASSDGGHHRHHDGGTHRPHHVHHGH